MNSIASARILRSTPSRVSFPLDPPKRIQKALLPRQLRDKLRRFQVGKQARACGTHINLPAVLAKVPGQAGAHVHAVVGGESHCRSPRCADCRNGLMSRRGDQIQFCIDRWLEQGSDHQVSMLTLTAPHHFTWSLPWFLGSTTSRKGMRGAIALLKERFTWRKDVQHYVSGLEITHGRNGWHCHFHVLVFHQGTLDQDAWFTAWADACKSAGLHTPSRERGLDIQPAESAAKYMAKWSVASEGVAQHVKRGKNGNRAIWEIEQAAAAGENLASRKLMTFNHSTLRARWHNFSRSLGEWREAWEKQRPKVEALFVFDPASSRKLAVDDKLACLFATIAADEPEELAQLAQAMGLKGQIPDEPDLVWVSDPARRALKRYEKAYNEERWLEASHHWAEYDFYVQLSLKSAAYQASESGGYRPAQIGNVRTFNPP